MNLWRRRLRRRRSNNNNRSTTKQKLWVEILFIHSSFSHKISLCDYLLSLLVSSLASTTPYTSSCSSGHHLLIYWGTLMAVTTNPRRSFTAFATNSYTSACNFSTTGIRYFFDCCSTPKPYVCQALQVARDFIWVQVHHIYWAWFFWPQNPCQD